MRVRGETETVSSCAISEANENERRQVRRRSTVTRAPGLSSKLLYRHMLGTTAEIVFKSVNFCLKSVDCPEVVFDAWENALGFCRSTCIFSHSEVMLKFATLGFAIRGASTADTSACTNLASMGFPSRVKPLGVRVI